MIASENYTSPAVMQAAGSVLTNKYAEGYPGPALLRRLPVSSTSSSSSPSTARSSSSAPSSPTCSRTAARRPTRPSTSPRCEPGDTVLGLDLAHGGHLTHGMKLNISGMLYHFVSYGVTRDTHRLDFDQIAALAREHKPKLIVAGASAYPREIPHDKFAEIAREVGAKLMVDMAHYAGLVAAGLHDNPVPVADFVTTTTHKTLRGPRAGLCLAKEEYGKTINSRVFPGIQGGPLMHIIAGKAVCFGEALRPEFKTYAQQIIDNAKALAEVLLAGGLKLVSGGTDNHLMLVDVTPLGIGGKLAEEALDRCGITINKNMIPYDERKPVDPSGIRIGTPALTTRGMGTGRNAQRSAAGCSKRSARPNDDSRARPHPRRDPRAVQTISRPRGGIERLTTEDTKDTENTRMQDAELHLRIAMIIVNLHSHSLCVLCVLRGESN